MAAAMVGILAVAAARKLTVDGAAVVVAAPQHMRPKRKPRGEQPGLKIS
jgi:transposase